MKTTTSRSWSATVLLTTSPSRGTTSWDLFHSLTKRQVKSVLPSRRRYQKFRVPDYPETRLPDAVTSKCLMNSEKNTSISCSNMKKPSASTIRPWTGQELQTQVSPQEWGAGIPETIQNTWGSSSIHWTNPGRMAKSRSGPEIRLAVQFTHIVSLRNKARDSGSYKT